MSGTNGEDLHAEAYRRMFTIRRFEESVERLYKNGEVLGSYHSSVGQEAAAVGACLALRPGDYTAGTHRPHGHLIGSGASLKGMMAELFGRRTGSAKGKGGHHHLIDRSVGCLGASAVVGSNLPIAAGVGLAIKQEKGDQVCLVFFGDGACQQGSWHESMNLTSLWKLPTIFFCENNLWAQDTPMSKETVIENYSSQAAGYGMPGVTVDGQDVLQVYEAVREAVQRARAGQGPSMVEARTYRFNTHSFRWGGLIDRRPKEEVEYWRKRDPLTMFQEKVLSEGILNAEDLETINGQVERDLQEAIMFARESPYPDLSEVFEDNYVDPSPLRRYISRQEVL